MHKASYVPYRQPASLLGHRGQQTAAIGDTNSDLSAAGLTNSQLTCVDKLIGVVLPFIKRLTMLQLEMLRGQLQKVYQEDDL